MSDNGKSASNHTRTEDDREPEQSSSPPPYTESADPAREVSVIERPPQTLRELREAQNSINMRDFVPSIDSNNGQNIGGQEATVRHAVQPHDTIQGVAIRYGVSVADLRRWNNLLLGGNVIQQREYLVIREPQRVSVANAAAGPRPFEPYRKMLAEFQRLTKCTSQEESFVYLSESQWELKEAMLRYQADLDWERNHPPPPPTTSASSSSRQQSSSSSSNNKNSKTSGSSSSSLTDWLTKK